MRWCKEWGITSNAEDYWSLPIGDLEMYRQLMDADIQRAQYEASRGHR